MLLFLSLSLALSDLLGNSCVASIFTLFIRTNACWSQCKLPSYHENHSLCDRNDLRFFLALESTEANKIIELYRSATKYRSKSKFHDRKSRLVVAFLVTVPGKQSPQRFWNAIKILWKQKWCRKSFGSFFLFVCFCRGLFTRSLHLMASASEKVRSEQVCILSAKWVQTNCKYIDWLIRYCSVSNWRISFFYCLFIIAILVYSFRIVRVELHNEQHTLITHSAKVNINDDARRLC